MKTIKENEIVIYESDNGPTLELKLMRETLWLTQRQMGELFEKDTDTIGLYIKNICSTNWQRTLSPEWLCVQITW